MFEMTQYDVDRYLAELPRVVAKEVGVEDYEFLDLTELGDAIFKKKPEAFVKLDGFVKIYREWWDFQVEKKPAMQQGHLSQTDFEKNLKLQEKRDEARKALIAEVRKK